MARRLTQRELRNQSGEIMRELDGGADFIVTRNGVAVGELIPKRRREFVKTSTVIEAFAGAPGIDYTQFRTDVDEVLDQDPTPRG